MTDESPLITLIIPTYKRPKLLRRALRSALNQTFSSFQVCVYDNASGDETKEVVEEFEDARVKYHCHTQNIGMIGNYAFALNEVKTPYFSLLSDDDLLFPWFFEEALKGFHCFPDSAFSAASTLILSAKGEIVRVPVDLWSKEGYFPPTEALTEMIAKYPIPTCVLFRKEVIEEVPIDRDNALTWDCDFLLQIAARYPIFVSKRPCGIFLHHSFSYSNAQNFEKWKDALNRMSERLSSLEHLSEEIRISLLRLIRNDLKACNRAFIVQSILNKEHEKASHYGMIFKRSYGNSHTLSLLLTFSKLSTFFPFLINILLLLKKIIRAKRRQYHYLYRHYASWLNSTTVSYTQRD